MPKVMIATPRTKPYLDGFVSSLWGTNFKGKMSFKYLPNNALEIARNRIVTTFKKSVCDALLWADVDATWHPEALQRLWDRDVPVVTAIVYRRALPPVPTIGRYKGVNPNGKHIYALGEFADIVFNYLRDNNITEQTSNELVLPEQEGDLVEVDGAGSHFLLVRREVYEQIPPKWYKSTSLNAGEDFYFCRQVRNAGIPIYADLSVHTGHEMGTGVEVGAREFLAFNKYTTEFVTKEEHWEMGNFDDVA